MMRFLRYIGLLVAGVVGASAVASAQTVPVQSQDLVGTWQLTSPPNPAARSVTLRRILTFRPDSIWLETVVRRIGADTISCTNKMQWHLSGDTLTWSSWHNISWKQESRVILQGQQLAISVYDTANKFIRTAPVERARNHFASRSTPPVTGTLAELIGTWKHLGGSANPGPGTIAFRRTFFPDSTIIETTIRKSDADTLACTQEYEAWGAQKQIGSSLTEGLTQYIVQGQRLSLFGKSDTAHTAPTDIYERMSASQEP